VEWQSVPLEFSATLLGKPFLKLAFLSPFLSVGQQPTKQSQGSLA
jgi:hypothetical protein